MLKPKQPQERKQLVEVAGCQNGTFKYIKGDRPWKHAGTVDVTLPCATQNELAKDEAEALISAGCKYVAEGSNMGCSHEAISLFEAHRKENTKTEAVWFAPGKSIGCASHTLRQSLTFEIGKGANAGGSVVSGLEMRQNSQRVSWTAEQVDGQLKRIMTSCFNIGIDNAMEYVNTTKEELPSLLLGSDIAGFCKVAATMHAQGEWW